MARVLGVGGVFFKSEEPDKLYQWYGEHLGIKKNDGPGVSFMTADLPATSLTALIYKNNLIAIQKIKPALTYCLKLIDL